MGLFRRNDPIESRAKALKARLADLESQIEQLDQAAPAPPITPPPLRRLKQYADLWDQRAGPKN